MNKVNSVSKYKKILIQISKLIHSGKQKYKKSFFFSRKAIESLELPKNKKRKNANKIMIFYGKNRNNIKNQLKEIIEINFMQSIMNPKLNYFLK